MYNIGIKRIYDPFEETDGYRVLVDRLWPRGISKEKAHVVEWAKSIAPSTELRKEFHQDLILMDEFKRKYIHELDSNEAAVEFLNHLREKLEAVNVTFIFAAKNQTENHAVILKEWIEKRLITGSTNAD